MGEWAYSVFAKISSAVAAATVTVSAGEESEGKVFESIAAAAEVAVVRVPEEEVISFTRVRTPWLRARSFRLVKQS